MRYVAAFAVVPILLLVGTATAQQRPESIPVEEWAVPWPDTRPRDPYVDGQNRVWFVGQRGDYVGRLDPVTGEFTRFDLDPGTGPHNLIVAEDGYVWYSGNRASHIGRLDPRTGEITKYPMPDPAVRDPHTLIADSRGDIWFTAQGANYVGKLTASTGEVRLIPMATRGSRPYGIVLDAQDRPWIALFGTNQILMVDPATMEPKTFELPEGARPRRIALTSDGTVWYVDYARGYLGRLDPATGAVREWAAPSGAGSRPYAMAADDQDRLWFVETGPQPNRFIGFDPETETFFSNTAIESGAGAVRHMYFDPATRLIWFGTDANTIGRAHVTRSTS